MDALEYLKLLGVSLALLLLVVPESSSSLDSWDFGMLAMSAARNSEPERAVSWLLHDLFSFDDVGMPTGGTRVPTPYFPGSGSLLLATAFMAEGWDGSSGPAPGFPRTGWNVRTEGMAKAL